MKILLRSLVLLLAAEAAILLVVLTDDGEGGANIGAGLLAFGLLFLGALVGGLLDGRRDPLRVVALRWVVVSGVIGAVETLAIPLRDGSLRDGTYDVTTLVSDLTLVAPMITVIVLTAAALGGVLGGTLRAQTPPTVPPAA